MKKYLAFFKIVLKKEMAKLSDTIGTVFGFSFHILTFCLLWEFVLGDKLMMGYTKGNLIWYVIFGESIIYSYYHYFKDISLEVENGTIAYNMTKPYNYILRIISEGIGLLPLTIILFIVGSIIGVLVAGPLNISIVGILLSLIVVIVACILLLCIHIIVGLSAIWVGKDTSSIWLIVQKFMLIFAFTPIELMPRVIQKPLLLLPTTHIIYTPSKLLIDFSYARFFKSLFVYELGAMLILTLIFIVIYRKGVKKLNVNGV